MSKSVLQLLFFFLSLHGLCQEYTVGLISYVKENSYEGFTLMYPHNQSSVFLIDNCGRIVQEWSDENHFRPGNTAHILENGTLIKTKRRSDISQDPIWAGGGGEIVEARSWDNQLIWQYEKNDSLARIHHDIEVLPNGNVLMIVWTKKSKQEAIEAGRDTTFITSEGIWPEAIWELDPENLQIVWEWNVWDHLIQDFDSTKANFGSIEEHPELIDINYAHQQGHPDWLHANYIDYNSELDQIMLCVPTFNELWIIDHSTTTEEAAGHTGGNSNKGGDLLFRFGNPEAYKKGDIEDQQLFYPHNAHWVNEFVDINSIYFNHILAFNNRVSDEYSEGISFPSSFDMYVNQYRIDDGVFQPSSAEYTFRHPQQTALASDILSSIQILPNNNILLLNGRSGYTFEIDAENNIVWEYIMPLRSGLRVSQGTILNRNDNFLFESFRYPSDYSAFVGKDMSVKGYIERNPDENACSIISASDESAGMTVINFRVFPNPFKNNMTIECNGCYPSDRVSLFSLQGHKLIDVAYKDNQNILFEDTNLPKGLYIIRVIRDGSILKSKLIQKG